MNAKSPERKLDSPEAVNRLENDPQISSSLISVMRRVTEEARKTIAAAVHEAKQEAQIQK
jgi:hypothetical protein